MKISGKERMKIPVWIIAIVLVIILGASLGIIYFSQPLNDPDNRSFQEFSFEQWFSNPNQYNGTEITIEGYYFKGFEIIVLSEKLEYSGQAEGHLIPTGRMLWVEGGIPQEIYESLQQQVMMGPTERYGQVRIKGKFEYGGEYGQLGQHEYQIKPSEVMLLPWTP